LIAGLSTPHLSAVRFRRADAPSEAPVIEIPQSESYSVIVQLADFHSHRLWLNHKLIHSGGHARNTVAVTDLRNLYACQHLSSYDNVRLSITRRTLAELGSELLAQTPKGLESRHDDGDETMLNLVRALLPTLHRREPADDVFIEHLSLAIAAHLLRRYGTSTVERDRRPKVQGLSPFQLARVQDYVQHHLGQALTLTDIADDCGMSRATFARAFKRTTGMTPFAWVRSHRIEQAKGLLDRSGMSMAAISAQCGFADQSHFCRVFTECVGVTPTRWRADRSRSCALPVLADINGEAS
jgi:AraC family transcriptional regulator